MTSCWHTGEKKGKGSPYSITERRVPELIPVLCSQPAGDVSHTPGGRMSLLSARPAVILAIQGCYQFCCLVNRGKTVNSLPKSSTLTTRLPSHPDTQWLGIGDARRGYTHNYSTGGSTDLTLRRVLKLANQRAAPAPGAESAVYDCLVSVCHRHQSTQLRSGERTGRRLLWSTALLLPTLLSDSQVSISLIIHCL